MPVARRRSVTAALPLGGSASRPGTPRARPVDLPHETELIEQICLSEPFARSPGQQDFLRFLYANRAAGLVADEIDEAFFGRTEDSDQQRDGNHTRERISNLRKRLGEYGEANPLAPWRCWLPEPVGMAGYGLCIEPSPWSAPQKFWMQHLQRASDVVVVTGSHLFFFHRERRMIVRYSEFNEAKETSEETISALREKHPEAGLDGFAVWQNVYFASGDILAHETLSKWFHKQTGTLVERYTNRDISSTDLRGKTPIYLGRTATNPLIVRIMKHPGSSHLRYAIDGPRGTVRIRGITEGERRKLNLKNCQISKDGVVGAVDPGFIFMLVTRMKNLFGHGHITIITCEYYAPAVARVVELMTDDKRAEGVLKEAQWPATPHLPESFEMLFRLGVSPDYMSEDGLPELVCSALYGTPLGDAS